MVLSMFGMAVGLAPVAGSVRGGYLAEAYTWRWTFHMLVPVGWPRYEATPDWARLDAISDAGGAMALLQLVLARGVRLDWFDSTETLLERLLFAIAFYVFIVHCLTTKAPFQNLYLFCDRNHAVGLVLVTIYGMLNFTPMLLLPPPLQQYAGFPDALVGEVVGCRGLEMTVGFLASALTSRFDPRVGMSAGFLMQVVSGAWMLTFDLNVTMGVLILNSLVQGFPVGLIWVPLLVVVFDTLAADDRAEASAVFHLLRKLGTSFFISLSIAEIVRATGANDSRMSEMITPYNTTLALPWAVGGWDLASVPGLAKITKEITRQAAMIGYLNGFMM
jgi:MFS transporter, DHA2 family, multidrug resistance protein